MDFNLICSDCGTPIGKETEWRCSSCFGPFMVESELDFDKRQISSAERSIWRYKPVLPPVKNGCLASLGEGLTPLIPITNGRTFLKLDYIMPTSSFKDRGSTVLISKLNELAKKTKITRIIEDSSGNAGASVAAYCARAGLSCEIFVPDTVSALKAKQIQDFGATVRRVVGSREKLSEETQKVATKGLYGSHVWNPYFIEGTKTMAYELAEDFHWDTPEYVFVPASAGTLFLGLTRGFKHLIQSGIITRIPKIVGVQCTKVSPVYHAFYDRAWNPPAKLDSIADALISAKPVRLREMLREAKSVNADFEIVEDEKIMEATRELRNAGFYAEPSAAVSFAAWKKWRSQHKVSDEENSVIILTGSGLKTAF